MENDETKKVTNDDLRKILSDRLDNSPYITTIIIGKEELIIMNKEGFKEMVEGLTELIGIVQQQRIDKEEEDEQ